MQPPLKSLNVIISQYFSIDKGEKSGEPGTCWHVQILSSRIKSSSCQIRGPSHSNSSLSLSPVSRIYRPFHKQHVSLQTWEELNHTFHWNGLSEGRQHLLSSGPGGPSHHWPIPMITCAKMIMLFTHAHTQNR